MPFQNASESVWWVVSFSYYCQLINAVVILVFPLMCFNLYSFGDDSPFDC